jgi:hypothetical protein
MHLNVGIGVLLLSFVFIAINLFKGTSFTNWNWSLFYKIAGGLLIGVVNIYLSVKVFHNAALNAEKEYQQQQVLAIRVIRDAIGNNNVTVVGSSFTPNRQIRIETTPRDAIPRVLTQRATLTTNPNGDFRIVFTMSVTNQPILILLIATDDLGVTDQTVFNG